MLATTAKIVETAFQATIKACNPTLTNKK